MTVLYMIKVKVHDCLSEKIISCKLLVNSIEKRVDLGHFPKIKMFVISFGNVLGNYMPKWESMNFIVIVFTILKDTEQWNCNAESLCMLQLF